MTTVNNDSSNVVVYRTELERVVDQWLWHSNGWAWVLALCVILFVARLVWAFVEDSRKSHSKR
jgi:hypothetical protein